MGYASGVMLQGYGLWVRCWGYGVLRLDVGGMGY